MPDLEKLAVCFRALGDPIRLRLLNAMSQGEQTVTNLHRAVGTSQENISKHLRILKEAGFVARRKEGSWVLYSIPNPFVEKLLSLAAKTVNATGVQRC